MSASSPGLVPRLFVAQRRGEVIEPLSDRSTVAPGRIIQVAYEAGGHAFGVILSIDGHGTVTLHHPATLRDPPLLHPRGRHPLPYAFELDDAGSFERFVFVASGDTRLDPRRVLAAAHRLADAPDPAMAKLDLPSSWHQSSLLLLKHQ